MFNRFETLWSAFVLKGAKHKVYFGADTGWWDGFAEIGAAYGPFDLTMLEIGAYHELWGGIHLGPDGAARAFKALGGKGLMMPIHWGLFDLALHAWRQPIQRLLEIAEQQGNCVVGSGAGASDGGRVWSGGSIGLVALKLELWRMISLSSKGALDAGWNVDGRWGLSRTECSDPGSGAQGDSSPRR